MSSFTLSPFVTVLRLCSERLKLARRTVGASFGSLPALIVVVLYICSLPSTTAQVQNGQLTGVIVDPSGGIITNAIVRVRNPATGYEVDCASNSSGLYTAAEMVVGSYTLQVQAPGFKTVIATGIVISAGMVSRVDFALSVGPRSESIEVSDAARQVNIENSRLSYTVASEQIENLPLNGRNVYDLIQYQPAATNVRGIMFETELTP